MKTYKILTFTLGLCLVLSACGTSDEVIGDTPKSEEEPANKNVQAGPHNNSGWETIEIVSNRPIITKLEQTATETPKRDQVINELKESKEFKEGLYGKPSDELLEDLSVQWVEGDIVTPVIEEIYGGHDGFSKEGVIFYENQTSGADQAGFWIGIKKPDDRLKELVDRLQAEVDAGRIKAEYIFIYYSPHTLAENHQLMNEVNQAVKTFVDQHHAPDRVSGGVSVNTITGDIEISHNFLTEVQIESLRQQFPERRLVAEQEGRMVPKEGEPDTFYPEEPYTNQLTKKGSYVMKIGTDSMLVVDAEPQEFSSTEGVDEFYSAITFNFPNASEKLKVGQRVLVEASGPILESYPGQGTALYVEVLPEYKPDGADLSESQVVQAVIQKAKENRIEGTLAIREITYDSKTDAWKVSIKQNDEENYDFEINDK
ncbi:uncharacterized protein DUF3221 [Bacillus oleivorans]|uniref:Uncharacterized protein DUF3221 n=1 Tax=Bacillus oleivorans TaxID=1448271 RepID=A0A285CYT1_9BACI|nr:DUF3221 domain-containing protein [Bacillus oleivorans]SNX72737.1 uncharacterized protein DUF3221 [Bacillus oleivorans]